jgi:RNA polymerase sigma-70 factor (ECF subfamily)
MDAKARHPPNHEPDLALARAWREHRRVALDVAYRLLGSLVEAEDAVQEAFARLARQRVEEIDDVRAWLVVVVSRICLDELGSARVRRDAYVGPWLPEPMLAVAGSEPDPADRITLDETVRMALLVVLERLTPAERVAFVLHDVFHLPFEEIAEIAGRTTASCRQLASRARRRIAQESAARYEVDRERERAVTQRFLAACEGGDLDALTQALDPDALLRADGGGKVQAPRKPVRGRDRIVKIIASGRRSFPGMQFSPIEVNGGPGMLIRAADGTLLSVIALTIKGDQIHELDLIGNPDKLARLESATARDAQA